MAGMRYQPQGRVRIDSSNPISKGLISVIVGSHSHDVATGQRIADSFRAGNTSNRSITPSGFGIDGQRGQAKSLLSGNDTIYSGSMFVIAITDNISAEQIIAEIGGNSSFAEQQRGIRLNGGRVGTYSRNLFEVVSPSGYTHPRNAPIVIGTTYTGAATTLYLDGVLVSAGNTASRNGPASMFNVGGILGQTSQYFLRGSIPVAFAWNRELSAEEMRSLSANPWQMFLSSVEDDDIVAQAASHVLSIESAALAFDGRSVSMRVSRQLPAQPAALALSSGHIALRAARRVPVASASLGIAAGNVQVRTSRRFSFGSIGLELGAGAVAIRAMRRMAMAPASLVVADGQVDMLYSQSPVAASYTLPLSAAAMTIAGGGVLMRVTRRLSVGPVHIAVSGQQVTFSAGNRLGQIDASKVPLSRTVKFSGGRRVVIFSGGMRVATFNGGKRTVRF